MRPLRRAVTWLFRRVVAIYFRDVEVRGDVPPRGVRGRLFVSNHVNAILDPILVFTTTGCDISPVAKSTLWKVPVFRYLLDLVESVKIVRRADEPGKQGGSNEGVFDDVGRWLQRGGNILIYPEGTSHNLPHLAPLRTGAARMWLRACEEGPRDQLSIQSVALEFDDREAFRSRVLVIFGRVRRASDFPASGDAFVDAVTEAIRGDLSELLVEGSTWAERDLVARAAELLAHDEGDASLARWSQLGRALEAAWGIRPGGAPPAAAPAPTPDLAGAERAVSAYHDALGALGLGDRDVAGPLPGRAATCLWGLALAATLPLAATGLLAYSPAHGLVAWAVSRVTSPDETGTIRLGVALAAYPIWTGILVAICLLWTPFPWSIALIGVLVASPFAALVWRDATPHLRRLWTATFRRGQLAEARALRAAAMERLAPHVRGVGSAASGAPGPRSRP